MLLWSFLLEPLAKNLIEVETDQRWNSSSKCALESLHYIGKMCTSEYPYGRGEDLLQIQRNLPIDGKLVHSIIISIFLFDHVVRTKAWLPITEVCESHYRIDLKIWEIKCKILQYSQRYSFSLIHSLWNYSEYVHLYMTQYDYVYR
jgi:hypothetical protein